MCPKNSVDWHSKYEGSMLKWGSSRVTLALAVNGLFQRHLVLTLMAMLF